MAHKRQGKAQKLMVYTSKSEKVCRNVDTDTNCEKI